VLKRGHLLWRPGGSKAERESRAENLLKRGRPEFQPIAETADCELGQKVVMMASGVTERSRRSVKRLLLFALIGIGIVAEWGLKRGKSSSWGSYWRQLRTLEPDRVVEKQRGRVS